MSKNGVELWSYNLGYILEFWTPAMDALGWLSILYLAEPGNNYLEQSDFELSYG